MDSVYLISIGSLQRMVVDVQLCGEVTRPQQRRVHGGKRRGHVVVAEVAEPRGRRAIIEGGPCEQAVPQGAHRGRACESLRENTVSPL